MNIILFESSKKIYTIASSDYRYKHIKSVLKLSAGDSFHAGIANGKKGSALITEFNNTSITVSFTAKEEGRLSLPITLIIGHPRPPAAKRIIKDCTSMGVSRIIFYRAKNAEKSYFKSKLWKENEFKKSRLEGAEQGGHTSLPVIERCYSLKTLFQENNFTNSLKLCFNKSDPNKQPALKCTSAVLAVGPERGWVPGELEILSANGFQFISLGDTILRTETAASSVVSLISFVNNYFRG